MPAVRPPDEPGTAGQAGGEARRPGAVEGARGAGCPGETGAAGRLTPPRTTLYRERGMASQPGEEAGSVYAQSALGDFQTVTDCKLLLLVRGTSLLQQVVLPPVPIAVQDPAVRYLPGAAALLTALLIFQQLLEPIVDRVADPVLEFFHLLAAFLRAHHTAGTVGIRRVVAGIVAVHHT